MRQIYRRPTGGRLAKLASSVAVPAVFLSALALGATSCGGSDDTTSNPGDPGNPGGASGAGGSGGPSCMSTRAYFAEKVWAPVMSKVCIKCHSPEGEATQQNAKLLLLPPGYPGFLDENLKTVKEIIKIEYEGKSELLRKPVGEMNHGGGEQIKLDSAEYAALAELVTRVQSGAEECPDHADVASFPDVVQLGALGTLRKASLHLLGRLPTATEIQSVLDGGEAALGPAITGLLSDPAFSVRLKEMFNDMLLTDRYMGYNGYAVDLLNTTDFPYAADETYDTYTEEDRRRTNRAVAREPLELINYIVKNDRPFKEILTAPFTVVNPYSARIYNVYATFQNPTDENEWVEAQINYMREGQAVPMPHAGVLTSPMFLNRFPTTPTNRNRHRARMVFQFFLATDILNVAERPIDPTQSTKFNNPTRDDSACNSCHRQIDPIAGAFQKFDDNDQERYRPERNWHTEMYAPGFGKEVMSTSDFANAPQWLAQRVVNDFRFGLASVHTVFTALTGQKPTAYPADTEAPDYRDQLAAWQAQDTTFRAITEKFVADNYNLKTAIREVILSPYYRALNGVGTLTPARATALGNVGTGRLSTPELLSRKIQAITGVPWARGTEQTQYLTTDYNILYGGIDSENVTQRLAVPNGVMASVQWRMANEVACATTAWDLSRQVQHRNLFPYVERDQAPEVMGAANATNVAAIKKNIQYLHAHLLGEELAPDDPEIERTYKLFYDTWKEGSAKVTAKTLPEGMVGSCRARQNPLTRQDLPTAERLENDRTYVVRSWQAVMTYLLSDYRFLYE
jgi:hypothetical protein